MTDTITISDLADQLHTTVEDISRRVTELCDDFGPEQIIHDGTPSTATCVLTKLAADQILIDIVAGV